MMIKLQATRSANCSGSLQLIIDTDNKTYKKGYFLTSYDVITIGSKKNLQRIIEQLNYDGFTEV
jgi:hypothetical protein